MDNYIVSARKYRPSTFRSVVGQKSLTTTLKNAIQTNKLAHAYLFCGPRGVGKTSCARIFAKTIDLRATNRLIADVPEPGCGFSPKAPPNTDITDAQQHVSTLLDNLIPASISGLLSGVP